MHDRGWKKDHRSRVCGAFSNIPYHIPYHTRHKMLERVVRPRLRTLVDWRWKTSKLMNHLSYEKEPRGKEEPPWMKISIELKVLSTTKKGEKWIFKRWTHQESSDELRKDVEIYTDGSTSGRQEKRGAGVCIRAGNGYTIAGGTIPARAICSSCTMKSRALLKALHWVFNNLIINTWSSQISFRCLPLW